MKPARFGRRYIALILDIFFLEVLGTLVTVPLIDQSGLNPAKILLRWGIMGKIDEDAAWLIACYVLMLILLWGLYFVGFTVLCNQTPGKKIMGLLVVRVNGKPVNWEIASIRFMIGYPLSLLPMGLGCYWALVDPYNQAWHDKLAGTQVLGPASS